MKKVAIVVSSPMTINAFLVGHIKNLSNTYDVTVIANFKQGSVSSIENVKFIDVDIDRKISIFKDLQSLSKLFKIFKNRRFDVVQSYTPKAGLLSMLSSRLANTSYRFHCFTGQVWANKSGFSRWLLKKCDQLTASCATHCLVDSESQRDFLIKERVVEHSHSSVLGFGSVAGVDLNKFRADPNMRKDLRNKLGFNEEDIVFLFLGRLNNDKGIVELIKAFEKLSQVRSSVALLVVGPDEEGIDDFISGVDKKLKIRRVGYTDKPQVYFNVCDIFCLPSHREGFGSVILEAAAYGAPSIASNIYGIRDAVVDGETGLLHKPNNVDSIMECMCKLVDHREVTLSLGSKARERVVKKFDKSFVEECFIEFYHSRVK